MSIDERLDAARREYRRIDGGPFAGDGLRTPGGAGGRRAPWVLSVAAAVVLVAVVAALVWRSGDDDPPVSVDTGTTVVSPEDVAPPIVGDTEPLAPSDDVSLEPGGAYADGAVVQLSVPSGFSEDWANESPVMCSTVTTSSGPVTSCDHVDALQARFGFGTGFVADGRDRREVVLSRRVLTSVGYRDCGDATVSCHVVVRRADGVPAASSRLEFEGPTLDLGAGPSLSVSQGSVAGELVVTPSGLQPTASWLQRGSGPNSTLPAFSVSVCAFGDGDLALDPAGEPWSVPTTQWRARPGLGTNCDLLQRHQDGLIDPDDPDRPFTIDVSRELYGYSGWSDCRLRACYVVVAPTFGGTGSSSVEDDGALVALLPADVDAPLGPRPTLTIVEPGPYREGQQITVDVTGVPAQFTQSIGVCRVAAPWSCGFGPQTGGPGSGRRTLRLPDDLGDCGLDRCYVALEAGSEGTPPPATVRLPVDPAAASTSPPPR